MRKLFPILGVGCATIIILGMIGAGVTMLIWGAKPFLDKLSTKRTEHQPGQQGHNDDHQPLPPMKQAWPGPFNAANQPLPQEKMNLLEARKGFETHPIRHFHNVNENSLAFPDPDLTVVRYGPKKLTAAIFEPNLKVDRKKSPAIIWVHSGTGVGAELWKELEPFREAGFVVMCPTFRGEGTNPGELEFCYGEVEDLLAAIDYVKKKSSVDQKRIYVVGQKRNGGTLALLAATTGDTDVRAFFALAPVPDWVEYTPQKISQQECPFDVTNREEARFRSPIRFTRFIKKPTFIFNPRNLVIQNSQSQKMRDIARDEKVPDFHVYSIPGANQDQFDRLIPLFVQKMVSDTGERCNIHFEDKDLAERFAK